MRFTTQAAGKTDVGCVRANKEDNFAYNLERQIFCFMEWVARQRVRLPAGWRSTKLWPTSGVILRLSRFKAKAKALLNRYTLAMRRYSSSQSIDL
jgi:hypothetical protein